MKVAIHSARRLMIAAMYVFGMAAAGLVQAAQPQLVGPRNTISRASTTMASQERSFEQLRASTQDSAMCASLRIKHYGHPGKGYNRVERTGATCGRSRLSAR